MIADSSRLRKRSDGLNKLRCPRTSRRLQRALCVPHPEHGPLGDVDPVSACHHAISAMSGFRANVRLRIGLRNAGHDRAPRSAAARRQVSTLTRPARAAALRTEVEIASAPAADRGSDHRAEPPPAGRGAATVPSSRAARKGARAATRVRFEVMGAEGRRHLARQPPPATRMCSAAVGVAEIPPGLLATTTLGQCQTGAPTTARTDLPLTLTTV
jgi:hypothetical protein